MNYEKTLVKAIAENKTVFGAMTAFMRRAQLQPARARRIVQQLAGVDVDCPVAKALKTFMRKSAENVVA